MEVRDRNPMFTSPNTVFNLRFESFMDELGNITLSFAGTPVVLGAAVLPRADFSSPVRAACFARKRQAGVSHDKARIWLDDVHRRFGCGRGYKGFRI